MILNLMIDDKPYFVQLGEHERNILRNGYKYRKAHDLHLEKYLEENKDRNVQVSSQDNDSDKEYQELYKQAHKIAMTNREARARGMLEEKAEIQ
jgi:hypothetical protein